MPLHIPQILGNCWPVYHIGTLLAKNSNRNIFYRYLNFEWLGQLVNQAKLPYLPINWNSDIFKTFHVGCSCGTTAHPAFHWGSSGTTVANCFYIFPVLGHWAANETIFLDCHTLNSIYNKLIKFILFQNFRSQISLAFQNFT